MKPPESDKQAWALAYGISMAIGLLGRKVAAPGFEDRFAERLDTQSRLIADRALLTLKEKGVI